MAGRYVARIVDVAQHGIKLEPTAASELPSTENEVHLLALGVAFGLGAAGYEHHPEPRDAATQTLEALLVGEAVMPWRAAESAADTSGSDAYVVCEQSPSGMARCHVRAVADGQPPPVE